MMAGLGDAGGGSTDAGNAGGAGGAGSGSSGAGAGGDGSSAGSTSAGGGNGGAGGGSTGAGSSGAGGTQGSSGNLGAGTTGATRWQDSLPDELKADPTLGKYSDVQNLARAHIELQKKFGQKGIFKPAPGASNDEIKAFREAMGIPTDPTKYDLGKFEGVEVPQPTLEWAQKIGVEHGIEPAALKAVITDYMKLETQQKGFLEQQAKTQAQQGLDALKKEWGDGYDRNLERANFAAKKLGGDDLVNALVQAKVHNNPALIKAFTEASKLYGEDRLREGGVGEGRDTPAELDAKIRSVQGRMFALKPTDGQYPALKTEFEALWKRKTGGK